MYPAAFRSVVQAAPQLKTRLETAIRQRVSFGPRMKKMSPVLPAVLILRMLPINRRLAEALCVQAAAVPATAEAEARSDPQQRQKSS